MCPLGEFTAMTCTSSTWKPHCIKQRPSRPSCLIMKSSVNERNCGQTLAQKPKQIFRQDSNTTTRFKVVSET
eukprot:1713085-Amphidinium_carterae.1